MQRSRGHWKAATERFELVTLATKAPRRSIMTTSGGLSSNHGFGTLGGSSAFGLPHAYLYSPILATSVRRCFEKFHSDEQYWTSCPQAWVTIFSSVVGYIAALCGVSFREAIVTVALQIHCGLMEVIQASTVIVFRYLHPVCYDS